MILQQKQVEQRYALPTNVGSGKPPTLSLTIPGQAFNLRLAMEQYKRGSLVDRVLGYYEKKGMEAPDFRMMDRIQKLEAIANYRKIVNESLARLEASHLKRQQHEILEKQKQANPTKAPTSATDTPPQPN